MVDRARMKTRTLFFLAGLGGWPLFDEELTKALRERRGGPPN